MPTYGDKLTESAAKRIQRDEDWKRSNKARLPWRDPVVPRNPRAGPPIKFPVTGKCAVLLDDKAGYCGAPNGDNAFRFCEFHANLYLNKTMRTR